MSVNPFRPIVLVVLTFIILSNLSEQEKIAKEIAQAKEALSETLSCLTYL
jgi:hypothetical protein